jgi:protein required for attachment to host cells
MDKSIVVIVNNNQARFFTLEPAEWPEYESGPNLIEQKSLFSSQSNSSKNFWSLIPHLAKTELASDSLLQLKGINQQQQNSRKLLDSPHKFERKFAQQVTSEIISLIRIHQGQKLILVAQSQILNSIKKLFTPTIFKGIQVKELNKDISHFHTSQIHQYLAQKQFIPACQKIVYPR